MFPSDPDLTVTDALVLCLNENVSINSKITEVVLNWLGSTRGPQQTSKGANKMIQNYFK